MRKADSYVSKMRGLNYFTIHEVRNFHPIKGKILQIRENSLLQGS